MFRVISFFIMYIGYTVLTYRTAEDMFYQFTKRIETPFIILNMILSFSINIFVCSPMGWIFGLYRMTRERKVKVLGSFDFNGIVLISFLFLAAFFALFNNPITLFLAYVILGTIVIYLFAVFFFFAWDVYSIYSKITQIILLIATIVLLPYASWILYFVLHSKKSEEPSVSFTE